MSYWSSPEVLTLSLDLHDIVKIPLPNNLNAEDLLHLLEIGHGYEWKTWCLKPLLVRRGISSRQGLPLTFLIGNELVVEGKAEAEMLRRLLTILDNLQGGRD